MNQNTIKDAGTLIKDSEIFHTIFEPKVPNRFICYMTYENGENVLPTFVIKYFERPRVIKVGEKWEWQPVNIACYDPIVPSTSQSFYRYIVNPKPFNMKVNLLGPVGDRVEEWQLIHPRFTDIDFGSLDWAWPPNEDEEQKKSKIEHINLVRYYKGSGPLLIKAKIEYESAKLIY